MPIINKDISKINVYVLEIAYNTYNTDSFTTVESQRYRFCVSQIYTLIP